MLEGYRRINRLASSRDLVIPGHDASLREGYPAAEGVVLRLDKPPARAVEALEFRGERDARPDRR